MVFDADKFLKVAVGVGILTAGVGVGYHYGIYRPNADRAKVERSERLAREQRQDSESRDDLRRERYDRCLQEAQEDYNRGWAADCKSIGINNKKENCFLPEFNVNSWNNILKSDRKTCLDEFKAGA